MKQTRFDVIVVGAGMVGAALACALGLGGKRVALLEPHLPVSFDLDAEPDLRVSAINRASQALFERLGVWQTLAAQRISPFENMTVWDATGSGEIHFDSAEMGEPYLGHIIENRLVQWALLQRLAQLASVTVIEAALSELAFEPDQVTVSLADGTELSAEVLVGADGAHSRVRALAGIEVQSRAYDQKGIVCHVATEKPHQRTAWQRFLPSGPLAFLPLADGRCSLVWSCDDAVAEQMMALSDEDFRLELAQAFDRRLGAVTAVSERAAFPLLRRHAEQYVKPRLALVGDAAHTIHPLAGQGVNIGLLDASALTESLLESKGDLGQLRVLRRYERWRRGNNSLMMHSMDGFYGLFGNDHLPLVQLRNFALSFADRVSPLKSQLMRHAMGLEGDLPELSRS
ncbi:MAG: UbiH/UbiF/VisC/COQ6 family ubiquinone biosynthesis hydroxylase [Gammaproteobacteria bacterium]|nr:UbiH/UbiF/VisC/COQ6 family ubiquinone biosynthesis hydroxylase [Gammaproteobacteria bacterium]